MQTRNSLKKFQQTADLVDSKELLYSHLQAREAVLQVLQVADPPLLRLPGVHHDHLGAGRFSTLKEATRPSRKHGICHECTDIIHVKFHFPGVRFNCERMRVSWLLTRNCKKKCGHFFYTTISL